MTSQTQCESSVSNLNGLPSFIDIKTENAASLNLFNIPKHYVDDVESVLVPHGLILDRLLLFTYLDTFTCTEI